MARTSHRPESEAHFLIILLLGLAGNVLTSVHGIISFKLALHMEFEKYFDYLGPNIKWTFANAGNVLSP